MKRHTHFNKRARFNAKKLETPRPPFSLDAKTLSQATHEIFLRNPNTQDLALSNVDLKTGRKMEAIKNFNNI
ncbi:hypothetical protein Tco_1189074, partial [Tanacetum coccineum]